MAAPRPPLFSVVVPTHNRAGLLPEAIDSLARQNFQDFEVLIVDDGSTDGTSRILDPIARTGRLQSHSGAAVRATVLHQRHAGVSRARAHALRVARGRYFANLDSDDLWHPRMLATLAETIRRHEYPAVIQTPAAVFRDRRDLAACPHAPDAATARRWPTLAAHAEDHGLAIGTNTGVVRRDVIPASKPFPGINAARSDTFFFLRLLDEGPFVRLEGAPLVGYRAHDGSISRDPRMVADGLHYILRWQRNHGFGRKPGTRALGDRLVAHLCRHFTRELLRAGHVREACGVFGASVPLQIANGRWGYAARFPLAAAHSAAVAAARTALPVGTPRPG